MQSKDANVKKEGCNGTHVQTGWISSSVDNDGTVDAWSEDPKYSGLLYWVS